MEPISELKKNVDAAGNQNEAKQLIEGAGMLLNEEDLDIVSGGGSQPRPNGNANSLFPVWCPYCNAQAMHEWIVTCKMYHCDLNGKYGDLGPVMQKVYCRPHNRYYAINMVERLWYDFLDANMIGDVHYY